MIKESDVLEHIGMCIDVLDKDELADLYNSFRLTEEYITSEDIELEEGWHLIPKEGAH